MLLLLIAVVVLPGARGFPILAPLYEALSAIIATGVGVLESLAGKRYQTWNPATSR